MLCRLVDQEECNFLHRILKNSPNHREILSRRIKKEQKKAGELGMYDKWCMHIVTKQLLVISFLNIAYLQATVSDLSVHKLSREEVVSTATCACHTWYQFILHLCIVSMIPLCTQRAISRFVVKSGVVKADLSTMPSWSACFVFRSYLLCYEVSVYCLYCIYRSWGTSPTCPKMLS